MSYDALDWWFANGHRYVDLAAEPQLWALVAVLARHTRQDPNEGAWPSQAHLAAVLGVKGETVGRYVARLEAKGVIKLVPRGGPQPSGKSGRKPHLYLLPEIAAHKLPPTDPRGTGGNPGEDPLGVTSDRERDTGDNPRGLPAIATGVTSDCNPGLPPIGTLTMGGEGVKLLKGREGAADASPPPPNFPNQCSRHQDDYNDTPCRGCMRQREHNEAAAEDDRELTRQEVADILGPDYQQAPTPPDELLDDPAACVAWQRKWKAERDAERLKKANAMRRPRGGDSAKVKDLAQRIIDRRVRHNDNTPWDRISVPTWNQALAMARNLAPHPWCGRCHEITRIVYEDGRPTACQCHPDRSGVAS